MWLLLLSLASAEEHFGFVWGLSLPAQVEFGGMMHNPDRPFDLGGRWRLGATGTAVEAIARTWKGPVGVYGGPGLGVYGRFGSGTLAVGVLGGAELGWGPHRDLTAFGEVNWPLLSLDGDGWEGPRWTVGFRMYMYMP